MQLNQLFHCLNNKGFSQWNKIKSVTSGNMKYFYFIRVRWSTIYLAKTEIFLLKIL